MKRISKINPFFVEIIFVLLFLSLSSLATLQLFMAAKNTSANSEDLNGAMIAAQSTAELIHSAESPKELNVLLRGQKYKEDGGSVWTVTYDKDWQAAPENFIYSLKICLTPRREAYGELLTAEISVFRCGKEEPIFELATKKYFGEGTP